MRVTRLNHMNRDDPALKSVPTDRRINTQFGDAHQQQQNPPRRAPLAAIGDSGAKVSRPKKWRWGKVGNLPLEWLVGRGWIVIRRVDSFVYLADSVRWRILTD